MAEMLGSYEVLDRISLKENRKLVIEYSKTGSSEVLYKIFQHNLFIVKRVMAHFKISNGSDIDDCVQEAFLALVELLSRYDPSKDEDGRVFYRYFYPLVVSRLSSKISSDRFFGVPLGRVNLARKIVESGYMFDAPRVVGSFGISLRQYTNLVDIIIKLGIFGDEDYPIYSDSDMDEFGCLSDLVTRINSIDLESVERSYDCTRLFKKLRKKCSDRDWNVFVLVFALDGGEPLNLRECGEVFGISSERVRQIVYRLVHTARYRKEFKPLVEGYGSELKKKLVPKHCLRQEQ